MVLVSGICTSTSLWIARLMVTGGRSIKLIAFSKKEIGDCM